MSDFDLNFSDYAAPPDSFYQEPSYLNNSDYNFDFSNLDLFDVNPNPNISSFNGFLNSVANLIPPVLKTVENLFGTKTSGTPLSQTTQKNDSQKTVNGVSPQSQSGSGILGSASQSKSNNIFLYLAIAGIGILIFLMRK